MRLEWLRLCLRLSATPADFYSGARKIIRNQHWTLPSLGPLSLEDAGYRGKSKLRQLERNYLHAESIDAASQLWEGRLARNKYGSVGFHCFNHYIKGTNMNYYEWIRQKKAGVRLTSKRASVMGPCIQSVSLTLLNDKTTSVDLFYRTTELFKKFPADLVFIRDSLLKKFDFSGAPVSELNFHWANVTCHPMYFVTLIPLLPRPLEELEKLRKVDRYFHDWIVKWTARYLCDEYMRGIENFQQAMRVRRDALEKLEGRELRLVQKYLRDYHPGYRNDPHTPKDLEEDDD